jgi:hypothetical protein
MGSRQYVVVALAALVWGREVIGQSPTPPPRPTQTASAYQDVQAYRLRLLGVYDDRTGTPIEGVEVQDVASGASSLTSTSGTVSLFFVPDGGTVVRLRKLGYEMKVMSVAISPADTTPLTVTLRSAALLPTVNIRDSAHRYLSPNLRGAESRMQSHAGGYFIDEEEMRKHDNSSLASTLLSRVPAIMTTPGPHGETRLVSARQPCSHLGGCAHPDCYIKVVIDGVPFSLNATADFSRMSPSDYAIAEFYPGAASMPVELGAGSPCGVLMLWSRER